MRLAPELKIIGKQTEQGLNMEYIFNLTEDKKSQHNIWCSMERAAEWSQALTLCPISLKKSLFFCGS